MGTVSLFLISRCHIVLTVLDSSQHDCHVFLYSLLASCEADTTCMAFFLIPSWCLVNRTLFYSKHLFSSSIPSCLTSLRPSLRPSLFLPHQMGHFMYAAKAFDVLERLDPEPEYWEGKRGACVGVFQLMIAGKASRDDLQDVLTMVRNTSNPQVEYIVRIIQKWCKDNNIKIT